MSTRAAESYADSTPRFGVVYKIINLVNGKIYVGQTSTNLRQRWNEHIHDARSSKRRRILHSAIVKYGSENFSMTLLDWGFSKEQVDAKEQVWIAKLDATNPEIGYNCTSGGSSCVHGPSSRALEKIDRRPPEAIAKQAAAMRGRKLSPERREKLIASRRGKKDTPEMIAAKSERMKQWWTPERRAAFAEKQRQKAAAGLRVKCTRENPNVVAGAKRAWELRRKTGKTNQESTSIASKKRWQDESTAARMRGYWTDERKRESREKSDTFFASEAGKIAREKITAANKARFARMRAEKNKVGG